MDNNIYVKLNYIALIVVFALGLLFRVTMLDRSPPSLNWDEAAIGYNAYSLLETGKDEYGYKFPLSLRSFDDYKPAVYSYIDTLFIRSIGLNEVAVRLPSALAGSLSIIAIFLISRKFFNLTTSVLAATLIAFEPWSVHFSRVAFEANLALMLTLFGVYFGLLARQKPKFIYLSIILLVLSAYTYHANRVLFLPIIVALIIYSAGSIKAGKIQVRSAVFALILSIPLFVSAFGGSGLARLSSTSLIKVWNPTHAPLYSIKNNPIYELSEDAAGRYIAYFSPANLFSRGTNEPNQQIHGFGAFHRIEFLFWIVGLYLIIKDWKKYRLLIFIILISPIPAAITWNWFIYIRVLLLFAIYSIVIAHGISSSLKYLLNRRLKIGIGLLAFGAIVYINSVANLATTLFLYLPSQEGGNWQLGFREVVNELPPLENYDAVLFETSHAQPHIFTLFYSKYPPSQYHSDLGSPDAVPIPRKNFDFGKYKFVRIYWPDDNSRKNTLFVGSTFSLPENDIEKTPNARILKDVHDDRGNFLARIVEIREIDEDNK